MAWDLDLPDGNLNIAQGDDDIRSNNSALESAMDREHEFKTGASQTGRHKFDLETLADFNLQPVPDSAGAIGLETDARINACIAYFDGVDWKFADIGIPTVPHTDEVNDWTVMQNGVWEEVTPAAGNIAIDFGLSPLKYTNVSTNVTVTNPINFVAGRASSVMLEMNMTVASLTVSWGNEYVTSNGGTPSFSDALNAVNIFYLTRLQSGLTLVSTQANVSPIV